LVDLDLPQLTRISFLGQSSGSNVCLTQVTMQRDPHNTDVIANINYFPATGIPIPKSEWKVKYLDDKDEYTRPMLIRDVRKANKTFDLDANGFTFVTLPQKQRVDRHSSEEDVKREYYSELEEVVKNLYSPTSIPHSRPRHKKQKV